MSTAARATAFPRIAATVGQHRRILAPLSGRFSGPLKPAPMPADKRVANAHESRPGRETITTLPRGATTATTDARRQRRRYEWDRDGDRHDLQRHCGHHRSRARWSRHARAPAYRAILNNAFGLTNRRRDRRARAASHVRRRTAEHANCCSPDMACRFCGVGDETTPNHGTSAGCVAALSAEIARLRRQALPRPALILDNLRQGDEGQPDDSVAPVAPKLALER